MRGRSRRDRVSSGVVVAVAIGACAVGASGVTACGEPPVPPSVEILEPSDGTALPGPNVRITLAARGIEIAPASEEREGTAHHHLFVDREATRPGDTIPSGVTGIIHLGRGQTDFVLLGVPRGSHRVIALLADRHHVALDPPAADTVRFTVTGSR